MFLIAQASQVSPLGTIGISLLFSILSIGMIVAGRYSIKTKSAKATKFERLMANEDGQLTGGAAVIKGYVLFIGGIGLCILAIVVFLSGIYRLIVG